MSAKAAEIFGIPIDLLRMDEALDCIDSAVKKGEKLDIAFLNAGKYALMAKDDGLKNAVVNADLRFADGMSVVWGGRMLGVDIPCRLAGIDLMTELLKAGRVKGYKFYLLGAKPEVVEKCSVVAKESFGAEVAGYRDGYFEREDEERVVEEINASGAEILFIGISSPMKELFIERNRGRLDPPVAIGVGGSFDVLAGVTKRAPLYMQSVGLEWLYRLWQEPARMWKRYFYGNTYFVLRSIRCFLGVCECCGGSGESIVRLGWRRSRSILFTIVMVKSLLFALLLPPWLGNDEPNHFDYVMSTAGYGAGEKNQLRIIESMHLTSAWERSEIPDPPSDAKTFNQTALRLNSETMAGRKPPLYYNLAAIPLKLFKPENIESALLAARLVSVAMSFLTVVLVYLAGKFVFRGPPYSLLAAAFAGLHPQFSYLGAVVNSDVLTILVFTVFFAVSAYIVTRHSRTEEDISLGEILLLMVLAGIGLLVKRHAAMLFPLLLLSVMFAVGGGLNRYVVSVIKRFAFIGVVGIVGYLAVLLFFTGSLINIVDNLGLTLGWSLFGTEGAGKLALSQWIRGAGIVFITFWFTYGQMVHKMSFGFYFLFGLLSAALFAGFIAGISKKGAGWERKGLLYSLIFAALPLAAIIFTFFSPELIERVSGRYLFYGLAPISILAASGIDGLERLTGWELKGKFFTGFIAISLVAVFGYLIPLYY